MVIFAALRRIKPVFRGQQLFASRFEFLRKGQSEHHCVAKSIKLTRSSEAVMGHEGKQFSEANVFYELQRHNTPMTAWLQKDINPDTAQRVSMMFPASKAFQAAFYRSGPGWRIWNRFAPLPRWGVSVLKSIISTRRYSTATK